MPSVRFWGTKTEKKKGVMMYSHKRKEVERGLLSQDHLPWDQMNHSRREAAIG